MISAAGFIIEHRIFLCQVMFKESFAELSVEIALLVPGGGGHPGTSSSEFFFPGMWNCSCGPRDIIMFSGIQIWSRHFESQRRQ
jgi:hypothetical protein